MGDIERIAQGLHRLGDVARIIDSSIASIAEDIMRVTSQVRSAFQEAAPQIVDAFQTFAKAIEQLEKADREVFAMLAQRGWLVSPSAIAGASLQIHAAIHEHGIETVELELISAYSAEECERILLACTQRQSFARWKGKLLAAMNAHKSGNYELAIPIWLMAVDGILADELSRDGRLVQDVFSHGKTKVLKGALRESPHYYDHYLDAFIEVIKTFGRQTGPMQEKIPVLSRHDVMHGKDPDFGSEKDSIQCIILLEVVHMLLENAERRSA